YCQAEDGIRDFHVTGVQTCALPICVVDGLMIDTRQRRVPLGCDVRPDVTRQVEDPDVVHRPARSEPADQDEKIPVGIVRGLRIRSEERRVGKRSSSLWSWSTI